MDILIVILLLIIGFIGWYLFYGAECHINGGSLGRNSWTMHFPLMLEELMWILPGGWAKKLKHCNGDIELAKTLPGVIHFVCMHILLPL